MYLNVDEDGVYYYDEAARKIYFTSYDGKEVVLIYTFNDSCDVVYNMQVYKDDMYLKTSDNYSDKVYFQHIGLSLLHDDNLEFELVGIDSVTNFHLSEYGLYYNIGSNSLMWLANTDSEPESIEQLRTVFSWNLYIINEELYFFDPQMQALSMGREPMMIYKVDSWYGQ